MRAEKFKPTARPRVPYLPLILVLLAHCHQAAFTPAADPTATIRDLEGAVYTAAIVGFEGQAVKIFRDGQTRSLEFTELSAIEFPSSGESNKEEIDKKFKLQLRNGTLLFSDRVESDGQQLSIAVGSRQFATQPSQLAWLQIGELDNDQQIAWQNLIATEISSDILAVKQPTGALTKIDGIVLGITFEAVKFEFGGTSLPVPFERLAGVRFFGTLDVATDSAKGSLVDQAGNKWVFTAISSAEQTESSAGDASFAIKLDLPGQGSVQLPLSELRSINFAVGNRRYLTELELVSRSANRVFDFEIPNVDASRLFGVQPLPALDLPGESRGPSLRFLGGGEAVYDVPEGFNQFVGSVELQPQGTRFTPCIVEIYLERELRWSEQLTQPKQAKAFDVPVEAGKRLRLVVRPTAPLATGDVVIWQQPSLSK